MKQHIIGLTGFAGTGKDTVADLMVTHLRFRKLAFADALRAEVSDGFGIDLVYLTHPSTKNEPMPALAMRKAPQNFLAGATLNLRGIPRKGDGCVEDQWMDAPRSPRQILQWWGTEYRRSQHRNYWTRVLLQRVVDYQRDGEQRFVITDCRFENEADTILTMGGLIWQVTRPGIDVSTTAEGTHISAVSGTAFKPAAVIANTHDIRHLQQLVFGEFMANETGIPSVQVTV
ncbi:hypothetical protein BH11PSE13_BH11PSE13_12460 [soil metagenome]